MRRKSVPAALCMAAALMTVFLAGCINAQATAMATQDDADALAREWDSGAVLLHIMGVEGSGDLAEGASGWAGSGGEAAGSEWARAEADDEVGDGRAEIWGYHYRDAAGEEEVILMMDADGNEVHREVFPSEDSSPPIISFEVDSDKALEIALEANDGFRAGTDQEHYGFVMVLGMDDDQGGPVWTVLGGGGGSQGGGGGIVVLDADSGSVITSFGGSGGPGGFSGFGGD